MDPEFCFYKSRGLLHRIYDIPHHLLSVLGYLLSFVISKINLLGIKNKQTSNPQLMAMLRFLPVIVSLFKVSNSVIKPALYDHHELNQLGSVSDLKSDYSSSLLNFTSSSEFLLEVIQPPTGYEQWSSEVMWVVDGLSLAFRSLLSSLFSHLVLILYVLHQLSFQFTIPISRWFTRMGIWSFTRKTNGFSNDNRRKR